MGFPNKAVVKHRPNWPFLYYELNGRMYMNKAPRVSRAAQLQQMEDALF